jgi:hypothetical protein
LAGTALVIATAGAGSGEPTVAKVFNLMIPARAGALHLAW